MTRLQPSSQNPGIEVEYRVTPWATWQETYTAAFAGDSPPDVSYVVDSFFPKYSDSGALVDLATLEGVDLATWKALYDPSIWDRGTRNRRNLWAALPDRRLLLRLEQEALPRSWARSRNASRDLG